MQRSAEAQLTADIFLLNARVIAIGWLLRSRPRARASRIPARDLGKTWAWTRRRASSLLARSRCRHEEVDPLPVQPREVFELGHVNSTLAGFALRDKGLRPAKGFRHFGLRQASVVARLPEPVDKGAIARRMGCSDWSPGSRRHWRRFVPRPGRQSQNRIFRNRIGHRAPEWQTEPYAEPDVGGP